MILLFETNKMVTDRIRMEGTYPNTKRHAHQLKLHSTDEKMDSIVNVIYIGQRMYEFVRIYAYVCQQGQSDMKNTVLLFDMKLVQCNVKCR